MNTRIKQIREYWELTQEEFGKKSVLQEIQLQIMKMGIEIHLIQL